MRNLVLFVHTSLDGFVAGPKGEMDWINVDNEIFDYAVRMINESDTALYGRVTYEMMEAYWPDAGKKLNASKHDIEHSKWYNEANKVVLSKTMKADDKSKTRVISNDLFSEIGKLKESPGTEILIFGSPSAAHSLMSEGLIDEFRLFINPVLLGEGIPLFKDIHGKVKLNLIESRIFSSGVIALHYRKN